MTVITDPLTQGVPLEDVKYLAVHSSPRTTWLYDRRQKKVTRNILIPVREVFDYAGVSTMTLNLGDPFEVKHQGWIRQRLPSYENVWQDFIGNNGFDWPLPMEGLTMEQEEKRKAFYQAHYTIAIQCFSIDQSLTRVAETLGAVMDVDDLHQEFDFLVKFINAIGIVRDNFVIMDSALDLNGTIANRLQEFYRVRSHVLHGPQMPYAIDDGYLKIPPIANENETPTDWHNRAL